MSFSDERKAIEKRFSNGWGTTTKIKLENVEFDRPATPWVEVTVLTGIGSQINLGMDSPLHRYSGTIVVKIFTKEDLGTGLGRTLADSAASIFRNAQFSDGTSGLIRCDTPYLVSQGTNEGWHQLQVRVPYSRDVVLPNAV